ncbi:MAG TPA: metallophosphoesterase [Burkholderiales bacterium]|nr:metallophosphoesterase [Burkholderiales bacterium]
MRPQSFVFPAILALLLVYTGYKAGQMWPARRIMAWSLALPFFALIVGWLFLYRSRPGVLDTDWFRAWVWAGSLGLGLWATFILLSMPADILRLIAWSIARVGHAAQVDPERRRLLSQWMSLGILGISAAIAGVGFIQAVRRPRITEVSVSIPNLPKALRGLTIAQITDLHVGPTIQLGYVQEVVRQTNALQADLIVVTGDMTDGSPATIGRHLLPLADLKAPLGTYYVTGNHEYYWGVERWLDAFRGMGLLPLLNENRVLTIQDAKLLLAGVTDLGGESYAAGHRSDPRKAIQSDEVCHLKILLAHRPESCFEAEAVGFDLQLSGHTHGGQFFPWTLLMPLAHKYYRGLSKHGRMWIFVSSGTGYWGPAHRFAVPSEIALLRLAAA